jgi:DNA-binding NarL/FixJ family response regulator
VKRALVVEDLPTARDWLADIVVLAFPGVDVTTADSITHARKACEAVTFDLVLVDLHLPDGSGVDLIREISERSPSTDCVVATIYDDDGHLFPALQAGARGYLLKENDKQQLVTSLKGIVAGTPPLSPKIARRVLQHFHAPRSEGEPKLTPREIEVLTLAAKGLRVKEIAEHTGMSPHTAADHLKVIYRKLNVSSRAEAALEASRRGLV